MSRRGNLIALMDCFVATKLLLAMTLPVENLHTLQANLNSVIPQLDWGIQILTDSANLLDSRFRGNDNLGICHLCMILG